MSDPLLTGRRLAFRKERSAGSVDALPGLHDVGGPPKVELQKEPHKHIEHKQFIDTPLLPAVIAASTRKGVGAFTSGQSVRALQFEAIAIARGERAFAHALERTRALAGQGITVIWGFDLDNTLYDTRARTLAIGLDFDAAHGTRYFSGITVEDLSPIGRDGKATATRLGMSPEHGKAYGALWDREFWNPARVADDIEVPDVMERARQVLAAGGTLRYVTGRAEQWIDEQTQQPMSFRPDTLARLRKSGLPADSEALVLKPAPGGSTPEFKREVLTALEKLPNTDVAGFVTDTLSELIAMRHVGSIPSFWVRTSFELARHSASPPWVYSLPQVM